MQMPVVVLEGINGAGKSSVMVLLTALLHKAGHAVAAYRDPGSTPLGEELRGMLKRPEISLCPMAQMLMFTAARVQLVHERLRDDLKAGRIVILDRWWMSTYAYQSIQGVSSALIITTNMRVSELRLDKDLCFFLDVEPETAMKRMGNMSGEGFKDRFEQKGLEFQQQLRTAYLDLIPMYLTKVSTEHSSVEYLAGRIADNVALKLAGGV